MASHFAKILLTPAILSALLQAEHFPEPYNSEPLATTPPLSAAEALAKFSLPDGFTGSVFAAEPGVQNPIAAAWDRKGRLWVAENYTYAERQKRFELALNDRVILLEDRDGDGKAETRKVFTDQVKMLTGIEIGHGGVWLMCPPQVLFIPDADEDGTPDGPPQVVLDGFDVAKDNYHNFANGLRWGPDGWLYGRCGHSCPATPGLPGTPRDQRPLMKGGIWRYHPQRKTVEVLTQGAVNSWGHDWDRHGEGFFINTVIGHLWHIVPGSHFIESGSAVSPNPDIYERMDTIADHYHFDHRGKWQDSRDGAANDFGGGHAHIGMMIYQANQWPQGYQNKLFTLNMHGLRTNVERLERHGAGYVGKHEPDVFLAGDPWFRGIEITQGPDGSAFILDWSDTGECHDHTGVHRTSGRIYKIAHGQPETPDLSDLDSLTPDGVERLIRNPNVWYERQLRTLLSAQKPSEEISRRILSIARSPENSAEHRLRALWTAYACGLLSADDKESLLSEPDEHLRVWGIRLITDHSPVDPVTGHAAPKSADAFPLLRFVTLAKDDPSGLVKLTLASTLQRLPAARRLELALPLAADPAYSGDRQLPYLLWFAMLPVAEQDPQALVKLASVATSPKLIRWIARYLAIRIETSPAAFNDLLAASIAPENQGALLTGIDEALAGISKATAPSNWKTFAASVTSADSRRLVQKLSLIFGDTSTLESLRKTVADPQAKIDDRQAALDILIDAKAPDLRELCESVLSTPRLNGNALRGLALSGDPAIAKKLVSHYADFEPEAQGHLIDTLTARPDWADILLDEISARRIPKTALPAFSARRIVSLKNDPLTRKLNEVWGTLNPSGGDKAKAIADLKKRLTPETLAKADLKNGRTLYTGICSACHILYGEGGNLGPDLTGSGRDNLDYLLENIIDPSAVVSADYRITTLTLKDGRVVAGTIGARTGRTLTLKSPAGDLTVETSSIEKQETTATSLMPEGLLTAFDDDQIRDLIAYLMHKSDVK